MLWERIASWTAEGYRKGASSINMMNNKITEAVILKAHYKASLDLNKQ